MSISTALYKQLLTSAGHTYNYYSSASPSNKTTILFVHGFPYTSKIWRHAIAHFEKLGYGCIAPDILGHGKTSKPLKPEEYVARVSAKSMMDILDKEGVDSAVVVGHDWGSMIASRSALLYPSRVQALVLVCIPYSKPGPFDLDTVNDRTEQAFGVSIFGYWEVFLKEPELLVKHIESFCNAFLEKDPLGWSKHTSPRGAFREWLISDGRCEVKPVIADVDRQDFFQNDWSAALQYYHCVAKGYNWEAEKDIPEDIHEITVPSLQVAASTDACSPLPLVQSTMGNFKDGKLIVIDGDHHNFLEHQDQFNSELETFFTEKGVRPQVGSVL